MVLNLIRSSSELLSMDRNSHYSLANDIDFEGKHISHLSDDFRGKLDGKGYKIKNLVISAHVLFDNQPVALFPSARKAEFSNLVFENLSVQVESNVYKPEIALLCVVAELCTFHNIQICDPKAEGPPLVFDSNSCVYSNISYNNHLVQYSENDTMEE